MTGFTDTHIHLHFKEFENDLNVVLSKAREAGVCRFLTVGTDLDDSRRALDLAGRHEDIFAAVGFHPHEAQNASEDKIKEIEELLNNPRAVAIGEIGLDFFRNHSPREIQKKALVRFFDLYRRVGKPLIIHCRDAYDEMAEMIVSEAKPPVRGVMHCFSSDKQVMKRFVDLGFYISFTGALTFRKNETLREACRACPVDRILLETDAPYLAPTPFRGKRNEPAYIIETAKTAAVLHGMSAEEFGQQTTINAGRLFELC